MEIGYHLEVIQSNEILSLNYAHECCTTSTKYHKNRIGDVRRKHLVKTRKKEEQKRKNVLIETRFKE